MMRFLPLLFLVCLTACSDQNNLQHEKAQELRLNMHSEPPSLDPGRATDTTSAAILDMVFEGLMRVGENGTTEQAVAEAVDVSSDSTMYTLHLRPSQWSNGDPVTAQDFEYAWKRVLSPSFPGELAYQMYIIKNAKQVKEGQLPLSALGVHSHDDKTLIVELEHPTPYFLEMLTMHNFLPVHRHTVEKNPDWAYEAGPDYIGNGPFRLDRWKHHNEITVTKNLRYWDADAVRLNKIQINMIEDANTELSLFENGALDWAGSPISIGLPTDAIPSLKQSGRLEYGPVAATYFFVLNTHQTPLDNKNFRQALAYAIDRQAIVDNILQGGQKIATGMLPPVLQLQKEPYFQDANVAKAQQLLKEALAEMHMNLQQLPRLTLSYNTSEGHHKIAQAIQQQWRKVLGLNIALENFEWKVYLDKFSQRDFTIARMGWVAPYNDPIAVLDMFDSVDNPMNRGGWHNAHYTDLINRSYTTLDRETRLQLLHEAEKILADELPIIPVYYLNHSFLKNPRLKGVVITPLGFIDFKNAYFDSAVDKSERAAKT